MVALSVYIQGKMTKCSEAFASGHVNLAAQSVYKLTHALMPYPQRRSSAFDDEFIKANSL